MPNNRLSIICAYRKQPNDTGQIGLALCVSRSSDNDIYLAVRSISTGEEIDINDCRKPKHLPTKSEERVLNVVYTHLKNVWKEWGENFDRAAVYSKAVDGFPESFDGLGLAKLLNNRFEKEQLELRIEA